ncbi:hypothetical protein JOB18_032884 [Solea senegalensis]|uniref:Uncharacterized protein n=1 Tax=Solea senegalensis TaxID=28829 RepID=A0AAV6RD87_SOLSE|nr:hypothetical protein JOB18_032884 [Solea senegalensis]
MGERERGGHIVQRLTRGFDRGCRLMMILVGSSQSTRDQEEEPEEQKKQEQEGEREDGPEREELGKEQ